jgi:3-hydroxyisobutyrate dehydrogenase-like beta-hydroxyacid dehydrogenase
MPSIGFIGLGDMGGAIARRIIEAGFPTTLWARREASYAQFHELEYGRAATPAELGAQCEVFCVCVFADDDVRSVLLGPDGVLAGMRPGGIVLIHSTIGVQTVLELAREAQLHGVAVLDAPVSGGRNGAVSGTLTIMVGGDEAAFEKAMPVMRAYGQVIQRLGSVGSGQTIKFLNNVLGFSNLRLAYLALELADRLGLDRTAAATILRSGSAASFNLDMLLDRLLPDAAFARHAVTMVEKDTRLFQNACAAAGLEPTLIDIAAEEAIEVVTSLGRRT